MSTVVIHGEGLGKRYHRGALQQSMLLRDHLSRALKSPLSVFRRPKDETFWALRDVSLEVREGEVLGLIGRNGAGKTTLLKILSRITKPTTGWAEIHGRVGSLLEVGTGFHPELTGRENTFLSGAILGMGKNEIKRKFDEVVAFAELEQFIDTPVKHYSSGMYVRLAFAVAAHLEPEILFVDEVLAVGDAVFQKKCLGKMGDVARHGRTILLVSHNMAAVEALCPRSILLEQGRSIRQGATPEVIREYLTTAEERNSAVVDLRSPTIPRAGRSPIFSSVQLRNGKGEITSTFLPGDDLVFEFELDPPSAIKQPAIHVGFDDTMGRRIFSIGTPYTGVDWSVLDKRSTIRCVIPDLRLVPGRYSISICVGTIYEPWMDAIFNAAFFDVDTGDYFGSGRVPTPDLGVMLVPAEWELASPCDYPTSEIS